MNITLLQQDLSWAEPKQNQDHFSQLMEQAQQTDLFLLPEMWDTGFVTTPEHLTDRKSSLQWMQQQAQNYHCAVAGSLIASINGHYYNRFYFVKPDQSYVIYDKRHLFTYGGEQHLFTPGSERVIIDYQGVKFLPLICYDLRFPVWSRNRKEYDCILYVANWPASRHKAWEILLRARAIENQCYVAATNRIGQDPSCLYAGGSAVIDPYGNDLILANAQAGIYQTEIDMDKLRRFREKFPVLDDADPFQL